MSFLPLANLLLAETDSGPGRVVYEFSRLHDYDDNRLPIALLAVVVVVLVSLVTFLYRRDTVELSRGLRVTLAGLRFVALAGLLVFFLGNRAANDARGRAQFAGGRACGREPKHGTERRRVVARTRSL